MLDNIIFGSFTLKDLLIYGGGIALVLTIFPMIKNMFKKEETSVHVQTIRCDCGWQGKVSRHVGRCPKCNAPIGDRKAG